MKIFTVLIALITFSISNILPAQCAPEAAQDDQTSEIQLLKDANDAYWSGNFSCARNACSQLLNCQFKNVTKSRVLINLAICDAQLDNWDLAEKEAKQGTSLSCADCLTQSDAFLVMGRCQVVTKKPAIAREKYAQSLALAEKQLGSWNCDLAPTYEGLAACEYNDGNLPAAKELYTKVAQLDYLKHGSDSTHFAWCLLSLSTVLLGLHEDDQAQILYKKVFWNFRHQNEDRIISELNMTGEEPEVLIPVLRNQLYGSAHGYENRKLGLDYITQSIPVEVIAKPQLRPHDFDNWFFERAGRETAPGLAFFDPRTKLKALIVTIHGLGLHHGAFTPFAENVQHKGFGVISFDVRGFGSYRNDEIYHVVDFKAIMKDLQRILTQLKQDYPNTPVFVLGESMGGAIALRLAAVAPDLVAGVVSSVPSGTRFHAKSTTLEVAVKFLTNSHKSFNIGQRVVEQATSDPDLRLAWVDDPSARMTFSATDLIRFQNFMNDNITYADKITTTPVIIFQGYSDELVKPLATLALYQAIKSKDKDLIFIGHSEHLIFEKGQFDQDVVDGCLSWLDRHIKTN